MPEALRRMAEGKVSSRRWLAGAGREREETQVGDVGIVRGIVPVDRRLP